MEDLSGDLGSVQSRSCSYREFKQRKMGAAPHFGKAMVLARALQLARVEIDTFSHAACCGDDCAKGQKGQARVNKFSTMHVHPYAMCMLIDMDALDQPPCMHVTYSSVILSSVAPHLRAFPSVHADVSFCSPPQEQGVLHCCSSPLFVPHPCTIAHAAHASPSMSIIMQLHDHVKLQLWPGRQHSA